MFVKISNEVLSFCNQHCLKML